MKKQVKPTITREHGREIVEHPAFGNISISRCTGRKNLFGSEIGHQQFITLRINNGYMSRSLSEDNFYTSDRLIEISLSESQWAKVFSSIGLGGGTPCTIESINNQIIPSIPDAEKTHHDIFIDEIKGVIDGLKAEISNTIESLPKDGPLPKGKVSALVDKLNNLSSRLSGNTRFVAEQFQEHMEKVTDKVKIEINAYAMQNLGMKLLSDEENPTKLLLPKSEE